ncbi:hypothetical protein H490_0104015 [Leucobacter sp. UCD-THU]|uniref:hypothetical protein n=1 Tax=Leucobacter sp. UCD-THU TaxID=1292023 RepID=UPI00037342DB|nr:hypothetical protein [Leucobacter sp. UCD-THU]EYT56041.1 hypothetical protein H490_0104015 [Leucobacter sp. UCD-THU]
MTEHTNQGHPLPDPPADAAGQEAQTTPEQPYTSGGFLPSMQVDHLFTPTHVFALRDTLAERITHHGGIPTDQAQEIAEGLLTDRLAEITELNALALAAGPGTARRPDLCDDGSCDGPHGHEHGTRCGHLCACGRGE